MAGWQDTLAPGSADTTDELGVDLSILAKLTISGDGSVTKLRYYQFDPTNPLSGNCKLALYDNSSPRALLGSASPVSVDTGGAAGYIEATLTAPVSVSDGQVVWITINNDIDTAFDARYLDGGAENASFKFEAYSGFPNATLTPDGNLTRTYVASAFVEDAVGGGTPFFARSDYRAGRKPKDSRRRRAA